MSMFQSHHSEELYHVGGHVAKRSMLSDANALRPSEGFSGLFAEHGSARSGACTTNLATPPI